MKFLLSLLFLFSFQLSAQVSSGDKLQASHYNGSTFHVGSVQMSILTESEFQSLSGNCWVQMDQSINLSGTDLANHTTITNIPDASGLFFRNSGGLANPLGQTQGDAIRNIIGKTAIGEFNGNQQTGAFSGRHSYSNGSVNGTQNGGGTDFYTNFNAGNSGIPVTDPVTGENRPVNMTLNFFIKINSDC